uniref:G-protein coupled receptors family 1 profile domain-containing protein n=1 Tax=Plectus sambesii TaxID=2011161 RepID=A0A914X3L1_9BILA
MMAVYGAQAVASIPTILLALLLAAAILKTTSLHFNVRISLANLAFATGLTDCGMGIVAFYQLYGLTSFNDEDKLCDWVALSQTNCRLLRTVHNIGSLVVLTSLLFLAVERLCATVQFKTYEQHQNRSLGIGLVVVQWLIVLASQTNGVSGDARFPYCQGVISSPRMTEIFVGTCLIVQLLGLGAFVILVFINKHKMRTYHMNRALQLLSTRYQLNENVKTTKLMVPISAVNCAIFAVSLFIIIVFARDLPETTILTDASAHVMISIAPWLELLTLSMPLFTVTFCAVTVVYSPTIRVTMFRMVGLGTWAQSQHTAHVLAAENANAKNIYFRQLQQQWKRTATHK